jgi:NTE family protein
MERPNRPTIGLALSGSGNRSSFYIGFLESLAEQKIPVDYIAACSGGSLVAAAYACGTLPEFKERVFTLNMNALKTYFTRTKSRGGFFSLDLLEEAIREFTKSQNFEEVRPLMGFVAVDIKTGEKVLLCMGDIARAARISCTLPGIFDPVSWGGKTLVDGGLLTMVPGDFLRQAGMDITIGISMRGTKHIFKDSQITAKKIYNFVKRVLFIDGLDSWINHLFNLEDLDMSEKPGLMEVVGKSLDLAIEANKKNTEAEEACDIMIVPDVPRLKNKRFNQESVKFYYEKGREAAIENAPKIRRLIEEKMKQPA